MNNILSTIIKRNVLAGFKRNLHLTANINKDLKSKTKEENPFILEEICTPNRTIRKHDHCLRQALYEFGLYVAACIPRYVQKVQMQHTDELEILVAPEGLFPVLSFMCHHHNACFNFCSCVTAIDVPEREFRFEVVYNLLSLRYARRARVKTYTDELTPLHSGFELWNGCNWYEREVYDMFGVVFTNHPDLRRILTDYGFAGHPLRKDFPLVGYTEVRFDDELKKIVYEPVEFAQERRSYRLESPWTYHSNFHEDFSATPKKSEN